MQRVKPNSKIGGINFELGGIEKKSGLRNNFAISLNGTKNTWQRLLKM